MNPPIVICFLAALLASTSAIPKFQESNEENSSEDRDDFELIVSNGADQYFEKNNNYATNPDGLMESDLRQQRLGWWWDHKGVHNLTVGYKTYQDRLLFSSNINKPSKFLRVVEQNVVVKSTHGEYISFIEAYDLHSDKSNAGYASVISGGPGTKSVTIHLESSRNQGLKFYVRVFGHY